MFYLPSKGFPFATVIRDGVDMALAGVVRSHILESFARAPRTLRPARRTRQNRLVTPKRIQRRATAKIAIAWTLQAFKAGLTDRQHRVCLRPRNPSLLCYPQKRHNRFSKGGVMAKSRLSKKPSNPSNPLLNNPS